MIMDTSFRCWACVSAASLIHTSVLSIKLEAWPHAWALPVENTQAFSPSQKHKDLFMPWSGSIHVHGGYLVGELMIVSFSLSQFWLKQSRGWPCDKLHNALYLGISLISLWISLEYQPRLSWMGLFFKLRLSWMPSGWGVWHSYVHKWNSMLVLFVEHNIETRMHFSVFLCKGLRGIWFDLSDTEGYLKKSWYFNVLLYRM